jgi:hypothetical protein
VGNRITSADLRAAGICLGGLRRWAEARGFNYRTLVREGVAEKDLRPYEDDPMVQRVLAAYRKRKENAP